ncbi:MAG TPA: hypothetical protein VEN81_11235, partial [Planctomycetota bacterium]|nr:hypothetical protein [Planctomycetota bacterium]
MPMRSSPRARRVLVGALLALAMGAPAWAQDLGAQWVDRINSRLHADKTPYEGGQFEYGAEGGVLMVYDSNIFLSETNRQHEVIWVPYARARAGYSEPQFEVQADLEADYKYYVQTSGVRDNDERFFADIGYAGSTLGASVIQFIRHESDPLDALFANRAERVVTDTIPRAYVDFTSVLAFELEGFFQTVHFLEDELGDTRDNMNGRLMGGLVYKGGPLGLDWIVQGGGLWIDYAKNTDLLGNPTEPPNVTGWLARGGARGDLRPDLTVELYAGAVGVRSADFKVAGLPSRPGDALTTMDASLFIRYKAIDGVTISVAYSRQVDFGFDTDPFQVINRGEILGE